MHPSDFYEYTMQEFVDKCRAVRKVKEQQWIEEWRKIRRIAYYTVLPHMGKKTLHEEDLFRLPGDSKKKRSRVASMSKEEKQQWVQAMREKLRQDGVSLDN